MKKSLFVGHFSFFSREQSETKMQTEGRFTILALADNISEVVDKTFPAKIKEFLDKEGAEHCFEIYLDSVVAVDPSQLGPTGAVMLGYAENLIGGKCNADILRLDVPIVGDEPVATQHKSQKFGDNIPFAVSEPDEPAKQG